MSNYVKNPNAFKTLSVHYSDSIFQVRISAGDTRENILNKIRTAIGVNVATHLSFSKHSFSGPKVGANYDELKEGQPIYASNIENQAGDIKLAMLRDIENAWGISSSDIFPSAYAPRIDPSSIKKARRKDLPRLATPREWSRSFIRALQKLAQHSQNAYPEALELLLREAKARQATKGHQNRAVPGVTTKDVENATMARNIQLKDIAEQATDNALFAVGLGEALEDIEREDVEGKKEGKAGEMTLVDRTRKL